MNATERKVQFSIRMEPEQKKRFSDAAASSGMDPSFAARQLLEMVVERVDQGGDMLDALYEIRQALRERAGKD